MNLHLKIVELEKRLLELTTVLTNQSVLLAIQSQTIEEQSLKIKEQSLKIEEQSKEIARLENLLEKKKIRITSKNSHLPPSKDLTDSSRNRSLREKSGKPIGGQKGHKGHNLRMNEEPDEIISLKPDYCNNCGNSLANVSDEYVGRRQVIDIPPIQPITTEYRQYRRKCPCGHCQYSTYPQGVEHPIQYGQNIQGLVIYQNIYQYMPFQRLQDFFSKVMNLSISKGTLENILRRSSRKAENAYESLRQVIEVSFFVGSDETGGKINGKKNWFWVWQNAMVTYIVAACSRSKKVIEDTFPDGLPQSIVCSDRLAAQLGTVSKGSQICLAHLLRDLNFLIDKEATDWAVEFKQLLKDAIALKREREQYRQDDPKVIDIEKRADKLLGKTFEQRGWTKESQHKTMTFHKGMVKLRKALFPFLYNAEVPPDNNGSERAIRPIKIKMKISGQFKSLQKEFAILRSVIDSAIKNGQAPFDAIMAIVNIHAG